MPYLDNSGNRIDGGLAPSAAALPTERRYLDDAGNVIGASVADLAKTRLAARGVTPEQVKAGVTPPEPSGPQGGAVERFVHGMGLPTSMSEAQAIGRHLDPFRGGYDDVQAGRYGSAAARLAGPLGTVGYDMLHNIGAEGGQQAGEAVDAAQHGEYVKAYGHMNAAGIPILGPPIAEGDYAGAAGRATMLAAPELIKGLGPTRAGAEATVAKVFGPDASPAAVKAVVPEMLDRNMIAASTKGLARQGRDLQAVGRVAEQPLGIDGKPVTTRGVSGKFQPRQVGPDERFGGELANLADAAPESGNGAKGGAVAGLGGYLLHKLMPTEWFLPGAAELIAVAKVAKSIYTSPLYRTTMGVVKNQLAKTLRAGDTEGAISIGARITGGQGLDDQFGHDRAVYGAVDSAYAQADGKASVARQILHGQEAVYVNPDGSEVAVPGHVTRSFINALPGTNLQHSDSGMAPGNAQGGTTKVGRQADVPAAELSHAAAERFRASHRPDAEWPSDPKGNNENDALFLKTPPEKLLPPQFKNARAVNVASPISGKIADDPEAYAEYGVDFPSGRADSVRAGRDYPNNMLIARKAEGLTDIVPHEVAHAIYEKDLTPAQRAEWNAHHASELKKLGDDMRAASVTSANDPRFHAVLEQLRPKYLRAIVNYANAPYESFAEAAGQYQANPAAFKAAHPQDYKIISDIFGRVEYIGGRVLPPPRDDAAR